MKMEKKQAPGSAASNKSSAGKPGVAPKKMTAMPAMAKGKKIKSAEKSNKVK
jgi:hypothetical protein